MLERIAQSLAEHQQAVTALQAEHAASIAQIATRLTQTLLSDGRILICGTGTAGALGQMFATHLNHRLDRERPSLPAMSLNNDTHLINAVATAHGSANVFAHQIRAMGRETDLVVILSTTGSEPALMKAVLAAHDQDIGVILLSQREGGQISSLSGFDDQELRLPSVTPSGVAELQLLTLNLLIQSIESQLFG
ncbi:MAG: D-sedoheptulose-7-phosphate isomerase [Litorivicinus sp.]